MSDMMQARTGATRFCFPFDPSRNLLFPGDAVDVRYGCIHTPSDKNYWVTCTLEQTKTMPLPSFQAGYYWHFKGLLNKAVGLAIQLVSGDVYVEHRQYEDDSIPDEEAQFFLRPYAEFQENIRGRVHGVVREEPRFAFIGSSLEGWFDEVMAAREVSKRKSGAAPDTDIKRALTIEAVYSPHWSIQDLIDRALIDTKSQ